MLFDFISSVVSTTSFFTGFFAAKLTNSSVITALFPLTSISVLPLDTVLALCSAILTTSIPAPPNPKDRVFFGAIFFF